MSINLTIPDDIAQAIKLPPNKIEKELTKELAFLLYEKDLISMGNARKFAQLNKWDFIAGLAERGIRRHYQEKELDEDIQYAKGD